MAYAAKCATLKGPNCLQQKMCVFADLRFCIELWVRKATSVEEFKDVINALLYNGISETEAICCVVLCVSFTSPTTMLVAAIHH